MSASLAASVADSIDDHVDAEIAACLDLAAPRSFFLFAGAGSGKTRSLVTSLQHIQNSLSDRLKIKGQRVGVITFTNAASDEIKRRILFDPLIDVRTIHSFSWSLIEGLNQDIRKWLHVDLAADVERLRAEENKGHKGTKASADRLSKIESKTKRLQNLHNIRRFVYSPTGDNLGRDALNHSEVLQLTAHFLQSKPAMQSILVGRYPILFIDESQDTNKNLIDALFAVESTLKGKFILGLIGDMMQRIYSEGKEGLGQSLPEDWATPGKKLNHRCPKRIVKLINKVRSTTDKQHQEPRSTAPEGFVRLFILSSDRGNKPAAEKSIAEHMATITADAKWNEPAEIKTLTLEHRMAAARMGFLDMFAPLYEIDSWRTSFLEGTLLATRFFSDQVLPLVKAKRNNDRFALARIAKAYSPLISQAALHCPAGQHQLQIVNAAIERLMALWEDDIDPTLRQVLRCVAKNKLLEIPDVLQANASDTMQKTPANVSGEDGPEDRQTGRALAIDKFLGAPFSQVEPFTEYLAGRARFDTHQGVKGLEFDRVMVIMDDSEARGFMFKYEDLFGGKSSGSKTVDGTKRLFYVTCSRAKESLALVAYTTNSERVRSFVINEGWFAEEEIVSNVPA